MHPSLLRIAEIVLLFGALFFTLPYVPSNNMESLPLLPGAAFALVLFAGSRALRWQRSWHFLLFEVPLFALFLFGANAVANLLYSL